MDRYYTMAIQFAMRDFISKVVGKYIEHLQELEPDNVEAAQKLFQNFQTWLYHTTNHK